MKFFGLCCKLWLADNGRLRLAPWRGVAAMNKIKNEFGGVTLYLITRQPIERFQLHTHNRFCFTFGASQRADLCAE